MAGDTISHLAPAPAPDPRTRSQTRQRTKRRPPLRSQATRDRILSEARRLFAERGYEHTTMRAIAAAANINVSIVARYYGSKADLFAVAARLGNQLPDLSKVPPDKRGEAFISHFIDIRERSDDSDPLLALVRSAVSHDVARQHYFEYIRKQADSGILSFIPEERRDEVLGLVLIQMIGISFSRYLLKHPSVTSLSKDLLIREIGAILQDYMADPSQDERQ